MTHDLVYVIGAPGAGKTTLVGGLVGPTGWTEQSEPIPHLSRGPIRMPGRRRVPFGGTDTLAMNIARKAEAWIASLPAPLVIGEGDRLAYGRFFDVAASAGYRLHLIHLGVRPEEAERRRAARADELGVPPQNPTWVQGRTSKAGRLAAQFGAQWVRGDTDDPVGAARALLAARGVVVACQP